MVTADEEVVLSFEAGFHVSGAGSWGDPSVVRVTDLDLVIKSRKSSYGNSSNMT